MRVTSLVLALWVGGLHVAAAAPVDVLRASNDRTARRGSDARAARAATRKTAEAIARLNGTPVGLELKRTMRKQGFGTRRSLVVMEDLGGPSVVLSAGGLRVVSRRAGAEVQAQAGTLGNARSWSKTRLAWPSADNIGDLTPERVAQALDALATRVAGGAQPVIAHPRRGLWLSAWY